MSVRIEVERGGGKALWRQQWVFLYFESWHVLVVDSYISQERETTRHKFQIIEGGYYSRLGRDPSPITEAGLIVPEDVAAEAMRKFTETLRVSKWSDRAAKREEGK